MRTGTKLFGISLCEICQDQTQDFVWVSLVLLMLVPTGFITGTQFVVEEVLLFVVLVVVKHRLPAVFEPFTRRA
jgi:hypothetical protein